MGLLQEIQRLNKYQKKDHKRRVSHAQQELLSERIEHVHFGEDGQVESIETINGLEALVLESHTLHEVAEAKREGRRNPLKVQVKEMKARRTTDR